MMDALRRRPKYPRAGGYNDFNLSLSDECHNAECLIISVGHNAEGAGNINPGRLQGTGTYKS